MKRFLLATLLLVGFTTASRTSDAAEKVVPSKLASPVTVRFAGEQASEVPDFQRHVSPLLGKLGCNGRACHGSFQGRGGFRLSLFGYDFKMDHLALTKAVDDKQGPRVSVENPLKSLMIEKPTEVVDHEGGLRLKTGTWEFQLLHRWIAGGAKGPAKDAPRMLRLEVSPTELVFEKAGLKNRLKAIAVWSDGTREDVTPLTRFKSNDDQVAAVTADGLVTAGKSGDTHVVAFYDSGVVPVSVIQPVSDRVGENYPEVEAPTQIDRLVVEKLRKLGVVPSGVCTDAEFLRRVSLDLTGTLPTAEEAVAFLKDTAPEKRQKKVEELLERPAYSAWWATRLCDFTGNNDDNLTNVVPSRRRRASQDWYEWLRHRVGNNTSYDKIVEGLVLATSRNSGESLSEFSKTMSLLYKPEGTGRFSDRPSMPHYWARKNFRKPEERAIGFAYTFLGIRIQCAQCHKHPFDQWTKDDFTQFQGFFTRVSFGTPRSSKDEFNKLLASLELGDKKGGQQRRAIAAALDEGKTVPFQEVYVTGPKAGKKTKGKKTPSQAKAAAALKKALVRTEQRLATLKKNNATPKQIKQVEAQLVRLKKRKKQLAQQANKRRKVTKAATSAKLLGDEVVDLTKHADARVPVMEWLRRKDNPLFARAFVNRVWAAYFNVGIVEPPDDHSLANPPSNKALLNFLSRAFIAHDYDIKWLHREIVGSRTYQLSWRPNETNRADERNFSHSIPRRLPAEVAYDAIQQATASDDRARTLNRETDGRAIAIAGAGRRGNRSKGAAYALTVFGRSTRESNCDCDRSSEPSLLQTVFLQNDRETLQLIAANRQGWVQQVADGLGLKKAKSVGSKLTAEERRLSQQLRSIRKKVAAARKANKTEEVKKFSKQVKDVQARLAVAAEKRVVPKTSGVTVSNLDASDIVKQAYLRTLTRYPSTKELARSRAHVEGADDTLQGIRDLLWVLMNTKEFIVNH
ncbi:MAG: hypothetical protein CMJ65_13630 [Planctomycetaceae bacterium]|nr:hypothetical protein [Planctomycetaceae bacterium]